MTVSEGVSVAHHFRNTGSSSLSLYSVPRWSASQHSLSSIASFLPRRASNGQLSLLIELIDKHTALHNATVISTECYAESIVLRISHRFLLVELARPGKRTIWLRLDRRRHRDVSNVQFVRAGGSTPANDTVRASLRSPSNPANKSQTSKTPRLD